jgi:hypothetical protein
MDSRTLLRRLADKIKSILKTSVCGLDSCGSKQGPVTGRCVHDKELSGSIKRDKFLDQQSSYQLFKKDSVLWSYPRW